MSMQPRLFIIAYFLLCPVLMFAQDREVRLGIILDHQNPGSRQFIDRIYQETRPLLRSKYDLTIDEDDILESNWDPEKIRENLQKHLNNPDIDMVIGVDALTSHVLASGGPYEKPVIACAVIDSRVQNIPFTKKGRSGVKNLTYLELPFSPERDLEVYYRMIGFNKVALLIDEAVFDGIPGIREYAISSLEEFPVEYEFVFITDDIQASLQKIDNSFDGAFFYPNQKLSEEQTKELIEGINNKGLTSFSVFGRLQVDMGVLAGISPLSNFEQMSRRVALNIQRIVNGEDPEDLNVEIDQKEEFVINMATARQIGYSPAWETLSEAVLINEERDDIERRISLYDVIEEALEQNLLIDITEKDVLASEEEVKIARSNLMPTIDAAYSHTLVDKTTAENSLGQSPQNRGLASFQLSQVIYSEQLAANKRIQDLLLKASEASLDIQTLDIILQSTVTYLNLMSAKTIEGIQKQNLELTRRNLELARVSVDLGQADPSDLYRWQGEIATAKADLINAQASRKNAELALNQLLNRDIDELFMTVEIDLNDGKMIVNNQVIDQYVSNPSQFYRFADFMVKLALERAPDIQQLDYNAEIQRRTLLLNQRNQYIPNFSLGGGLNYELYRAGAGTEPGVPGIPPPNDLNWSVQVGASIPIFQSGQRRALVQQSKIQLEQIGIQQNNLDRLIEQQVRTELENIKASYTNIELTQDAANAQLKNFELIQDSYSQGQVSVTQLLDAQTAAVSAQLNSANAVYIMLIDVLNFERATGAYFMVMTDEEKSDFIDQLIQFFNEDQN